VYTEDDKRKYKSILVATNAITPSIAIYGVTGDTNIDVIAPLLKDESTIGKKLPRAMTLNERDRLHWDDELVDRMRLLEASRQAGAHDNEMLSNHRGTS